MATIEHRQGKRGDGWRVKIAISRKPIISRTFQTRAEAEAWGAATEANIRAGDLSAYEQRPTGRAPRPKRAVFYDPASILDHDEIVSRAQKRANVPGVYFLIRGGSVVYVGQSVDAPGRIEQHKRNRDFDSFYIIPAEKDNLLALEAKYIHKLNPIENKSNGTTAFPAPRTWLHNQDGKLSEKRKHMARSGAEAGRI